MRYRGEAAFSRALVKHLKDKGYFVQRIESGETGRGIPDIYVLGNHGFSIWLELKNIRRNIRGTMQVTVPWRPGQQAWLREATKRGQYVLTLCAANDCILVIPHDRLYSVNVVKGEDVWPSCSLPAEVISFLRTIGKFLNLPLSQRSGSVP